jgi:hypothetical protein
MPKKLKPLTKAVSTPELNVPKELLGQLVRGPMAQGDLESMFRSLKKEKWHDVLWQRECSGGVPRRLGISIWR